MEPRPNRPRRRQRPGGGFRFLAAGAACALLLSTAAACMEAAPQAEPSPSPSPAAEATATPEPTPTPTPRPTPTPTPTPPPTPEPTPDASLWNLRLVNKENPLPRDFAVELSEVEDGQFDSRAAGALTQMLEDMRAQGLSPVVCSSFRTWEDQEALHENKIRRLLNAGYDAQSAQEEADRWVVPAGASEHQLGLAADIVSRGYQMLVEEQEDTPEQQWLMEHCQEYGFILRYPKDKQDVTQVGYEPWHYRYVGEEAAGEIMAQGICLEEYLGAE